MGANCRHKRDTDLIPVINLTNNTRCGCSIMNNKQIQRSQIGNSFFLLGCSLVVKVDAECSINMNDNLLIMNNTYKVVSIDIEKDEPRQARLRKDYNNFTGAIVIGLK